MYGMVNKAVEEMVCRHHGEAVWERIKAKAGVDVDVFISNDPYPDEITYRLVVAASEIIGVPADRILEAFGEHWVLHTARDGYGGLMQAAGRSLPEFLKNLNNLHTRVVMIFPKLRPPRFECTEVTGNSLRLHHFTERPGLAPFVVGLVQGLGKMFGTPATVRLVASRTEGADHDEFTVEWTSPSG